MTPVAQLRHGHGHGVVEPRLDHVAQAAAIVFEFLGLDTDQQQCLRQLPGEVGGGDDFLEAGLVQAHLLGTHEARHLVALDAFHRPRRQAVVDRVEHDQAFGALHVRQQVEALGTAIHHGDTLRHLPLRRQMLDATHAETLVGP
jgi:hypothetical protein